MQTSANRNWRLYIIFTIGVLLWLTIIVRLFFVQVVRGQDYSQKAAIQQSRKFEIPATRGLVYVREAQGIYPVALNTQVYTLAVDPKFVKDKSKTAERLSQITQISQDEIESKMNRSGRYVELSKDVSTDLANQIKEEKMSGVILQQRPGRYYPESSIFSHVLGYVNDDGEGQYGFEQFQNSELKGQTGRYNTITDALGVPIDSVENTLQNPKAGRDYVLTIDRGLQATAAETLKKAVSSNRAESGSIVVMDVRTGAIKALVNYPDFDPNAFREVKDYSVFTNRAVSSLFEPGSGFKVITMAAGLETGVVKPETKYNDTGEITVSGKVIKNAENHKYGIQTMGDVIQKSLNTGVVYVLQALGSDPTKITVAGKQVLRDYIEKFGFGVVTGIEQSAEVSSKIKPANTYDIDYANISFGQGISVNSVQLTAAVGAIANNGVLLKPRLIEAEVENEQITKLHDKKEVRRVMSEQNAKDLATIMTRVVENGSGYLTKMPGYKIAGKTGTAQVPRLDGKGYEANKNIGSFVGFAPADDPRFVMLVRIDYPKVEGFAEKTAVPAFATMTKELFKYYQIAPSGN